MKEREHLNGFQIGRENTAKKGATVIPQTTDRPPEPIKRDKGLLVSLSGSMALEP